MVYDEEEEPVPPGPWGAWQPVAALAVRVFPHDRGIDHGGPRGSTLQDCGVGGRARPNTGTWKQGSRWSSTVTRQCKMH